MSSDLVAIQAQLNRIMQRLDLAFAGLEPDLTITGFAKRAHLSTKTIHRRIAAKELVTRNGRIPASELSKVLS